MNASTKNHRPTMSAIPIPVPTAAASALLPPETGAVGGCADRAAAPGQKAAVDRRAPGCDDRCMAVIRINVISVDPTSGDELAHRFAARAGAVDGADGFEGFELLKPTDERTQWLVITRWRDEESFAAWTSSSAFAHGHRSQQERDGGDAPRPVGMHSEVWSYETAVTD